MHAVYEFCGTRLLSMDKVWPISSYRFSIHVIFAMPWLGGMCVGIVLWSCTALAAIPRQLQRVNVNLIISSFCCSPSCEQKLYVHNNMNK